MMMLLDEFRLVCLLFEVGIDNLGIVVDGVAFLPVCSLSVTLTSKNWMMHIPQLVFSSRPLPLVLVLSTAHRLSSKSQGWQVQDVGRPPELGNVDDKG